MHKKYEEYVQQQHAPMELIERTKKQMELEEQHISSQSGVLFYLRKKKIYKPAYMTAIAACFCGILIFSLTLLNDSGFTYTELESKDTRLHLALTSFKKELTLQEYDTLIGTHFSDYQDFGSFTRSNDVSYVTYKDKFITSDEENREIEADFCILTFTNKNGHTFTIHASKTKTITPNAILSTKPNQYLGCHVYLACQKDSNTYFASFQKNDMHYFLEGKQMTKQEMDDIIKKVMQHN